MIGMGLLLLGAIVAMVGLMAANKDSEENVRSILTTERAEFTTSPDHKQEGKRRQKSGFALDYFLVLMNWICVPLSLPN